VQTSSAPGEDVSLETLDVAFHEADPPRAARDLRLVLRQIPIAMADRQHDVALVRSEAAAAVIAGLEQREAELGVFPSQPNLVQADIAAPGEQEIGLEK